MIRRLLSLLALACFVLALGGVPGAGLAKDYVKCGFDSDCHAGVKCNGGVCADAAGSKCGFDSDCGGKGAKCNSGKCSTAPDGKCSFNSECPGGACSSGKCKF